MMIADCARLHKQRGLGNALASVWVSRVLKIGA